MIDLSGLVLHSILRNPAESIEAWAKVKVVFLGSEYAGIYSAMTKFYAKHSKLPSFSDLDLSLRDNLVRANVKALEQVEVPEDTTLDIIVDSLINEYAQNEAIKQLDIYIDNIVTLDAEEIKQELANILLHLEEKTHTSESVCLMSDIHIFESEDEIQHNVPLGINNTFDSDIRAFSSELIMIGGARGSGKSVVATNIYNNQYLNGGVGLYFSIEMTGREVFHRSISSLAGVEHKRLRNGELTPIDLSKIAKVRADMFLDSEGILQQFKEDGKYKEFELALTRDHKLKPDNQLIIVDNQRLTLADIDMNIQKFKAQFGDKLTTVIVDYVNQIEIEDIYSWKQQITLSKQLKNFARKYEVSMITPYQIDKEGEARFAKGILDAADMSMNLTAESDHIKFESTKTRGTSPFTIYSGIDWETLTIDSREFIVPEEPIKEKETTNDKKEDMPW